MGPGDPGIDAHGYSQGGYRPAPEVRFDAISAGWEFFKARAGTWILTGLIVLVAQGAVQAGVASLIHQKLPVGGGGFRAAVPPAGRFVSYLLSSMLSGFFLGGMFRMACLQVRGQEFHVRDLFGVFDVLENLIVGLVLCAVALFVAAMLCVIPVFIVAGVLMFTLPLIVDGRMKAIDALRMSWNALKGQWLTVTIFHFILNIFSGMGVCLCGVGLLFTMPLYCLSIAVLYRDFFLQNDSAHKAKPFAPDPDF